MLEFSEWAVSDLQGRHVDLWYEDDYDEDGELYYQNFAAIVKEVNILPESKSPVMVLFAGTESVWKHTLAFANFSEFESKVDLK